MDPGFGFSVSGVSVPLREKDCMLLIRAERRTLERKPATCLFVGLDMRHLAHVSESTKARAYVRMYP